MNRLFLLALACGACGDNLTGEAGFAVGRTTVIPCDDSGGDPGALVVVESLQECWVSRPGERLDCDGWLENIRQQPEFCSNEVVFDSPSESTLTGFFGPPIDRNNVVAAGTTRILELACNPGGPSAPDYPNFLDFLSVYAGDITVTEDNGDRGKVEFDMYVADPDSFEPNLERPALQGTVNAGICR